MAWTVTFVDEQRRAVPIALVRAGATILATNYNHSQRSLEVTMGHEEQINHPEHYGGDTTYEAIKVIEAWGLGFCLGNTVKYIARAEQKGDPLVNLKKARWYLDRAIQLREAQGGTTTPPPPRPSTDAGSVARSPRTPGQARHGL